MIQKRRSTHLNLLIKTQLLKSLELIHQPWKVEPLLRRNGKESAKWYQNYLANMILSILTKCPGKFQKSLISEEYGNTTENTCSSLDSHILSRKRRSMSKMPLTLGITSISPTFHLSISIYIQNLDFYQKILLLIQSSNLRLK